MNIKIINILEKYQFEGVEYTRVRTNRTGCKQSDCPCYHEIDENTGHYCSLEENNFFKKKGTRCTDYHMFLISDVAETTSPT